jgi:KAP family P-loop domain
MEFGMKLFPEEEPIVPGTVGFDNKDSKGRPLDLLERKPLGQRLTDLVDRIEQPLVIAFDGGWGSGKSHFLRLWTGAHALELGGKAKIVYFDAFEHDYLDDPLVSLVSRLIGEGPSQTLPAKALKKLKKAAYPLARTMLRIGAAVGTAGATEVAGPIVDAAIKKVSEVSEQAINEFWKKETGRIAAMQQFRDALIGLTEPAGKSDPPQKIVFIIDELDRCRPDYALTLLEIIKHFFSVPNLHFVLGTNLAALEYSVRARYGTEINATEYLGKFIHLRMSFPKTRDHQGNGVWATYLDHLTRGMGLGAQTAINLRTNLSIFGKSGPISLRDTQRLASRVALLPKELDNYMDAYSRLATSALILELLSPVHYLRLRSRTLTVEEIEQLFPIDQTDENLLYAAKILHNLWRYVLLDDPGEETLELARNAFDRFDGRMGKGHFEHFWSKMFDTFHLPDAA